MRIYKVWGGMKSRCYNPNANNYKYYGGRGISVSEDWKDNFLAFYKWSMENGYKEGLTLDREDNGLDYSPENCRWVTMKVQCNNRRNSLNLK